MKKIGKIFSQDLKSIRKNLVIFVVVIGITILPALYAWFNIAANWDPYSNTGELPFAVCNLDKGYEISKGVTINAGEKIMENINGNRQMGWRDLKGDEEEAKNGVKRGDYYASFVIPADFSENLLSLTTGKFQQAKLAYYVNEKKNAVAPKITDKGIELIQDSVNSSYVSTIAEAIATILNLTDEKLEGEKNSLADKAQDLLETAKTETGSFRDSVNILISTLDSIDTLIKDNQEMLPKIQSALAEAGIVAGDVKSTLSGVRNTASQFTGTVENLISSGDAYLGNISAQLDETFGTVSQDASALADKLVNVKTVNEQSISLNNKLISVFQTIESNLGIKCDGIISRLNNANDKQQAIIDKIVSIGDTITKTGSAPANAKAELDALVSEANSEMAGVKSEFSAVKQSVDNTLNKSFTDLDKIADFTGNIDLENGSLNNVLNSGLKSVASLKTALNNLNEYFDKIDAKIDTVSKKITEIKNDKSIENMILPIIENPKELGAFISAPVSYSEERYYEVENYGSAMTPFYSALALWVGGIVLVAVLNVDLTRSDLKKIGKANSVQLFFGRYMVFFVAGQIQALIIALGDLYFLKIQCKVPLLFIVTCLISSFVYTLIIYSLTITFSVIGKALSVIILILQVAGSGGTFPIEVLPDPYKAIAPFLPFKYGINVLRETVAGMDTGAYLKNLGFLLLFIVPALLLGLLLRKPCIKIICFFNKKIEESDLII